MKIKNLYVDLFEFFVYPKEKEFGIAILTIDTEIFERSLFWIHVSKSRICYEFMFMGYKKIER
jgi:hypothetical protein